MKIVLCDDQPDILRSLQPLIESFFAALQVQICVESYACLDELMAAQSVYDIAFLDIELPDGNGLQAAKHLQAKNKNIIVFIVTSYQHYLDDAMDLNVFRYISKPIDPDRLAKNLHAAWKHHCAKTQMICIGNHGEAVRVYTDDILYIYIKERGTELVTIQGSYESTRCLGYWGGLLDDDLFAQPHYSYLVNLHHVVGLKKRAVTLLRPEGETIVLAVSQRMYPAFKKAFFAMMGGSV